MVVDNWTANASANGTSFTTATNVSELGTASLSTSGSGQVQANNIHVAQGGVSYRLVVATSAIVILRLPFPTSQNAQKFRFSNFKESAYAATLDIASARNASTYAFRVRVTPAGRVQVVESATVTNIIAQTADGAWVPGKWNRIEVVCNVGTTTSNGTLSLSVYREQKTSGVGPFTTTTANLGTLPLTYVDFGNPNDGSVALTHWFDSLGLESATGAEIGPHNVPLSTVLPVEVESNAGGWITSDVSLEHSVNDASDSTYATNPGTGTGEVVMFRLPPLLPGNVVASFRAALDTGQPNGTIQAELLQGTSTVITTWSQLLTSTSLVDVSKTLNSGELAAITNRNDLYVRLTANP